MRIAVIGSGISGVASAWLLSREHAVTLFEANDYLGGHTHTHEVQQNGIRYAIDSGFIVHNPHHYPLLTAMFAELGVHTRTTTMSFSVRNEASGLEYNAATLRGLFCQRRNLVSPRFLGMLRDLLRFYREARALLQDPTPGPTLAEYLEARGYGAAFRDDHLLPMASALWSSPPAGILSFPAKYLVQFMANHNLLQTHGRPEWRVVSGGSSAYIRALRTRWRVEERLRCPVRCMRREAAGVLVESCAGTERFDHVVLACHSDQSLSILGDASDRERDLLGAIPFQVNETVLHTDASVLPLNRKAWAAWNSFIPRVPGEACTVSYCMNLLQGVQSAAPFIVTLNRTAAIAEGRILKRMRYEHPVYTHGTVRAQARRGEIQGRRRTWYAGAYWGWGFHEDGLRSAVEVCAGLGVRWAPAQLAPPQSPADPHRMPLRCAT